MLCIFGFAVGRWEKNRIYNPSPSTEQLELIPVLVAAAPHQWLVDSELEHPLAANRKNTEELR
jgi:hypothetical protein